MRVLQCHPCPGFSHTTLLLLFPLCRQVVALRGGGTSVEEGRRSGLDPHLRFFALVKPHQAQAALTAHHSLEGDLHPVGTWGQSEGSEEW